MIEPVRNKDVEYVKDKIKRVFNTLNEDNHTRVKNIFLYKDLRIVCALSGSDFDADNFDITANSKYYLHLIYKGILISFDGIEVA